MRGFTDVGRLVLRNSASACMGIAAALVASGGVAYGAINDHATLDSGTGTPTVAIDRAEAQATAPRFVTGYSLHCSQEMAEDNVTGAEVDWVVENYYLSAAYNEEEETWRYPGPTLIVVLNNNGFCVTVFRP